MWSQLNASLPPALRVHDVFTSAPMARKNDRLKEARNSAERCNRTLARDRTDLERKERQLMDQIRHFALKEDLVKARIAARQIAHYRTASDRNYESAAIIATRAQLMVSNHKINQAKVEALKGSRYACKDDTIETVMAREMKYAQMMSVQEEMERIMNEGMDDVYEDAEELIKRRDYFDLETQAILQEALDPNRGHRGRTYTHPNSVPAGAKVVINLRVYKPTGNFRVKPMPMYREANIDDSVCLVAPSGDDDGQNESSSAEKKSAEKLDSRETQFYTAFPNTPTHLVGGAAGDSEDDDDKSSRDERTSSSTQPNRSENRASMGHPDAPPGPSAHGSLRISNLCLSISMLKHQMLRDTHLMTDQLKISKSSKQSIYDLVRGESSVPFRLGRVVRSADGSVEEFEEFGMSQSLKDCGVSDGGVVYVVVG
ncbi:hypothetical protein HDU81_011010 [Chytriomyces hyalinus]|nr:hypothetical protein HDU81_011010 [Chytriomyces hyalinus]